MFDLVSLARDLGTLKLALFMLYEALHAGCDCLNEIRAGFRTEGIDGS